MSTSFPTSLDAYTRPGGSQALGASSPSPKHSDHHDNAYDAIEAIEAKVGTGSSTPTSNTVLAGTGTGASSWSGTPTVSTITATGAGSVNSLNVNTTGAAAGEVKASKFTGSANTCNFLGVNVNTTGAGTGQVKTSSHVYAGGKYFAGGATLEYFNIPVAGQDVTASSTVNVGSSWGLLFVINATRAHGRLVFTSTVAVTDIGGSSGFTVNSDSGSDIAIYTSGGTTYIKNRYASTETLAVFLIGR